MPTGLQPKDSRRVGLSVVSHGQRALVQGLLDELSARRYGSVAQVVLTLNLPEAPPQPPPGGWPFELIVHRAERPAGFSANHNRAAALADTEFLCIINPDIRFPLVEGDPFSPLAAAAVTEGVGLAYPLQIRPDGTPLDHERAYPTPWALLKRHLFQAREHRVDWVNGACMVVLRSRYVAMGGLDERFRMYCEDVEWCLRLQSLGLRLVRVPVTVVHATQRASRRSLAHMIWHFGSLFRLWRDPRFWRAVNARQGRENGLSRP